MERFLRTRALAEVRDAMDLCPNGLSVQQLRDIATNGREVGTDAARCFVRQLNQRDSHVAELRTMHPGLELEKEVDAGSRTVFFHCTSLARRWRRWATVKWAAWAS